jgi:antirestriction protein ArdC
MPRSSTARAPRDATPTRDHYADVTNQIIASLEAGVRPWRKTWDGDRAGGISLAPRNGITGHRYRGINVLLLGLAGAVRGPDPRWMTYKQAEAQGWQVRRGERGSTVFFYRQLIRRSADTNERPDATEDGDSRRRIPLMRSFTVFHASQIDGIPPFEFQPEAVADWQRPEAVQIIAANSGAQIFYGGDRACYAPMLDQIRMPPDAAFESMEAAAATLLHELSHWSGHESRLNRDLRGRFGTAAYAQEELRAELASAFMGTELGLTCDIPNHADYLADWLKALANDKREIFRAASDAQRIADYLLGFHPEHAARLAAERQRHDNAGADTPAPTDTEAEEPAEACKPVAEPALAA